MHSFLLEQGVLACEHATLSQLLTERSAVLGGTAAHKLLTGKFFLNRFVHTCGDALATELWCDEDHLDPKLLGNIGHPLPLLDAILVLLLTPVTFVTEFGSHFNFIEIYPTDDLVAHYSLGSTVKLSLCCV